MGRPAEGVQVRVRAWVRFPSGPLGKEKFVLEPLSRKNLVEVSC